MLNIFLVRPGCTEFDVQGRIKGSMDIPLNDKGEDQVEQIVAELADQPISTIYQAPCQSATQTAKALAKVTKAKIRELDSLANLDHGLWHGKLIDEVKRSQPKVYKLWQENPESIRPPEGETVPEAAARVARALRKICKRHREGTIAIVASEPLASVMTCFLNQSDLRDLWKSECDCGNWESLEVEPAKVMESHK